jgi:hemerythrin-like metal-binding protein
MLCLEWSVSHAVFVTEMDDEHAEIFEALGALERALAARAEAGGPARSLVERIDDHFAHEERLMYAARYASRRWHTRKHDAARRRVRQFVERMSEADPAAGAELVEYLKTWLDEHTRLPDMMLAAFLRNHRRGMYKMTFRAGTRPADSCEWVDSRGEKFDPGR